MKRIQLYILVVLLLFLPSCGNSVTAESSIQPVAFYYQTVQTDFGSDTGVICSETRDLGSGSFDYLQIMDLYAQGPASAQMESPLPKEVSFEDISLAGDVATVTMNPAFSNLTGSALSIASSCIAKTLLQFEEIQMVRIQVKNALLDGQESLWISDASIVLKDEGATVQTTPASVYYADKDAKYLLEEPLLLNNDTLENAPEYLMEQLLEEPKDGTFYPVMPEGTILLDISVENTVCVVDFSAEFLANKPEKAWQERMTVFSVVNTLTSLDSIDSVIILVEGETLHRYVYLDLSQPLHEDQTLIGPVRSGMNEFDAVLCLPMNGQSGLFACPVRLKENPSKSKMATVMDALIHYTPLNGYFSLLPSDLKVNSFTDFGGTCQIDFSADPLENCSSKDECQLCLQSIALSFGKTVANRLIQITVNGVPLQQSYPYFAEYCAPDLAYLNY